MTRLAANPRVRSATVAALAVISLLGYVAFSQAVRTVWSAWDYRQFVLTAFLRHPHLPAFGIEWRASWAEIAATFAFLGTCALVGRLVARGMSPSPGAAPMGWVAALAAAIVPTLLVALVRWPDGQGSINNVVLLALQMPVLAAVWLWSNRQRTAPAHVARSGDALPIWLRLARWSLLPYAAILLMYGLVDVHGFDSFSQHLAVPARWLVLGRLAHGLPADIVTFYPGNMELLVRWALSTGTDRLAFLIPFGSSVLAVWVVYRIALLLRMSRAGATASALSAATLPLLAYQSVVVYTDTFTTCCLLIATWMLLAWIDDGCADHRLLAGFGLALGLAIGAKHSAAPSVVVLGLAWAWHARRRARPSQWFIVTLSGAVASTYWYLRNAVEQGNPVYPVAAFGKPGVSVAQLMAGGAGPKTAWDVLTYPWVETGFAAGFEVGLGPCMAAVVVLGVALAPWLPGSNAARRTTWAVLAGSTALWILTGATVPRFGLFPIMLSCVFVGALWQHAPSRTIRVISATCWGLSALAIGHEMVSGVAYADVMQVRRAGVEAGIDRLPPSRILSAVGEPSTYYAMGTGYRHQVLRQFQSVLPADVRRLAPDYLLLPADREAEFTAVLSLDLIERWAAGTPGARSLWRVHLQK